MARLNLLDTRTTSFGDLISNSKIYRVPTFQRDYAWEEEHWDDLWQDILILQAHPDRSHYLGAIVLQNSLDSDKEFTIIDGQQRLVTLSIIAIAVIAKIGELVEEDERNRERQELLKQTYLSARDPRSLRYSSRLILNENNKDFYESNLINLRKVRNLRAISKSNQMLWGAFSYFSAELDKLLEVSQTGESLTSFLTETIGERLLFIQINVEDELNAYTVFETLNARGLELSSTDLLKNYLFSLLRGPDDLREGQRQWRQIINTVSLEKFPEFLRYYLSLSQGKVRKERLFKVVRDEVKDALGAFNLLDRLENYSYLFIALGNPHDEFWQDTPDNRDYVRALVLFRVKQQYPTLLAAYDHFTPNDFTKLLKLIVVVSFRYLVVSGLNPNQLEEVYNRIAIAISKKQITTPRQVFTAMASVYVEDQKFQQDFSIFTVSTKSKKSLVKYILVALEKALSCLEINPDSFSIEHILPEVPTDEWRQSFTEAELEQMTYRLGNLTPLEPSFNRDIGRRDYLTKRDKYQQSKYALTQEIVAEEWTADGIVHRQESLARRAMKIWRSDFV